MDASIGIALVVGSMEALGMALAHLVAGQLTTEGRVWRYAFGAGAILAGQGAWALALGGATVVPAATAVAAGAIITGCAGAGTLAAYGLDRFAARWQRGRPLSEIDRIARVIDAQED